MKEIARDRNFEKIIVETVQSQTAVIAWHSVNGVVSKCELRAKAFRKDYAEIELIVKDGKNDEFSKVLGGNRVLNIYLPASSISFSAPIKGISEDFKIKVSLPESYQFFERRENERVQTKRTSHVSFEFQKTLYKKVVFDVSTGGFSFIVPRTEKMNIAKGNVFPMMMLEVNGRKIKVKAECVNSFSVDRFKFENLPYGGHKVAFRFLTISIEDQKFLDGIVDEILKDTLPFVVNK